MIEDCHVLGALSGLSALLLAWSYPLWGEAWQVLCPLRELTGIPCPTCYGTRALLAVARLDWLQGLRYNPLVAAAGIGLFVYVPWGIGGALLDRPRPLLSQPVIRNLGWSAAVLVGVNWLYLIVAHV